MEYNTQALGKLNDVLKVEKTIICKPSAGDYIFALDFILQGPKLSVNPNKLLAKLKLFCCVVLINTTEYINCTILHF